jgi:hypothetical protein
MWVAMPTYAPMWAQAWQTNAFSFRKRRLDFRCTYPGNVLLFLEYCVYCTFKVARTTLSTVFIRL